jgi:hypothetical protein
MKQKEGGGKQKNDEIKRGLRRRRIGLQEVFKAEKKAQGLAGFTFAYPPPPDPTHDLSSRKICCP